jgi:hypothetical protein
LCPSIALLLTDSGAGYLHFLFLEKVWQHEVGADHEKRNPRAEIFWANVSFSPFWFLEKIKCQTEIAKCQQLNDD